MPGCAISVVTLTDLPSRVGTFTVQPHKACKENRKQIRKRKKARFIRQNEHCWMFVCDSYLGLFPFTLKMLRDLYLHLGVRSLLDK